MKDISRRNFLEKISGRPILSQFKKETARSDGSRQDQPVLSRREALRFFAVAGLAAAVGPSSYGKGLQHEPREDDSSESALRPSPQPEYSYSETAIQTGLLLIGARLTEEIFKQLHIPHGNKSLQEKLLIEGLREHPLEALIKIGIVRPLIEEYIFRLRPSQKYPEETGKMRWDVGIPVSILFALAHNISYKKELGWDDIKLKNILIENFAVLGLIPENGVIPEKIKEMLDESKGPRDFLLQFSKSAFKKTEPRKFVSDVKGGLKEISEHIGFEKSIPISQFMAGIFLWYLMREKGFSHAVLAHAQINSSYCAIGSLLLHIYPPGDEEKVKKILNIQDTKK